VASDQTRIEKDSMGPMEVPAEAYYGAQTRRAELNFPISDLRMPRAMIRALGLIKASAASVNAELGKLDDRLADAIQTAALAVAEGRHDDQFVVDVFQTGSGTSTNMNTNEVIAGIANETLKGVRGGKEPVHPNDHVNMGQSSNDVFPTAIHLAALEGLERRLLPELRDLQTRLKAKAQAFDRIVKIGRTHLQDAVPIRLGQEFSGYAAQVANAVRRIEAVKPALAELPIGGTAVGTGLNTHERFSERVTARLRAHSGLPVEPAANTFESMANKDAAVEASAALRTVAISLSNIANNVRWLASGPRCGVGELRIPELQPGSSIMPGKVNPVIPEALMMVAAQVVGNDATIGWANGLGSNFELNVMMPVIASNLLQSIELLSSGASVFARRCVEVDPEVVVFGETRGIEPREDRCRELIERSLAMCTALAPRIGYDAAAAVAKKASNEGRTVREIVAELVGRDPADYPERLGVAASPAAVEAGPLTSEEVERLLDPARQTHPDAES